MGPLFPAHCPHGVLSFGAGESLTLQGWVPPGQEADHGLQLAEPAVLGVDVRDAVDPGTHGARYPEPTLCPVSPAPNPRPHQSLARLRSG